MGVCFACAERTLWSNDFLFLLCEQSTCVWCRWIRLFKFCFGQSDFHRSAAATTEPIQAAIREWEKISLRQTRPLRSSWKKIEYIRHQTDIAVVVRARLLNIYFIHAEYDGREEKRFIINCLARKIRKKRGTKLKRSNGRKIHRSLYAMTVIINFICSIRSEVDYGQSSKMLPFVPKKKWFPLLIRPSQFHLNKRVKLNPLPIRPQRIISIKNPFLNWFPASEKKTTHIEKF